MKIVVSALFAMACTFPDKSNDNNNNDEQNLSCDKIWHENKLLREEVDRLRAQLGISPKDDTPHQHAMRRQNKANVGVLPRSVLTVRRTNAVVTNMVLPRYRAVVTYPYHPTKTHFKLNSCNHSAIANSGF